MTASRAAGAPPARPAASVEQTDPKRQAWFDTSATDSQRPLLVAAAADVAAGWLGLDCRYDSPRSAARHIAHLLDWLDRFPGDTYQQCWVASGADAGGDAWAPGLNGNSHERLGTRVAANALVLLGVLRPSYEWLLTARLTRFWRDWIQHHDQEAWAAFAAAGAAAELPQAMARAHATALSRICVHTGLPVTALRGGHILELRDFLDASGRKTTRARLPGAWHHARRAGLLVGEPDNLEEAVRRGRCTPAQLVDRYHVVSRPVRALLIDYLTEMSTTHDYSTQSGMARTLVKLFWRDLEQHHPGLDTIALSTEQAAAWKQRVLNRAGGQTRRDYFSILGSVRTFYLDIAAWAHEQPRWAQWAVPCPIADRDLHGNVAQRRAAKARMQARTRALAPHLPRLAALAAQRRDHTRQVLTAARTAALGERFTLGGIQYTRVELSRRAYPGALRLLCSGQDKPLNPVRDEERAFWAWAIVEVLRHSGVRLEELLELTHLSIQRFTKPDGEVIPLLQIAPSKTDRERIVPASPALASALAQIITRHLSPAPNKQAQPAAVPLCRRYDPYERTWSAPLPFLFQYRNGPRPRVMANATVTNHLAKLAEEADLRDTDGTPLGLTPHDFRRLFITDLVTEGFPIHLAAMLVGHANEYREPTQQEWADFDSHFARRKIALGDCRRPYGSDCAHEHACLRCQFLQVDADRGSGQLDELEHNLQERLAEAEANAWLGDIEQLRLTLTHLHRKRVELTELLARSATSLPTPVSAGPGRPTPRECPIFGVTGL